MAQVDDPNVCDQPDEAPDVLLWDIHQLMRHGNLNGISSYSIGTTSCNVGSCWLEWDRNTNQHPVIGQNMFRLKDGRLEQIGQSWLKHGFFAVSRAECSVDCLPTDGSHLGVNCSDPYDADFNGLQQRLGPKSEVNPVNGEYVYPFSTLNETGDVLYKRLQVHDSDLDPLLNPGALHFVEGQYVTADDAAANNDENNVAHRQIGVSGSNGFFNIVIQGGSPTHPGPALDAWVEHQPGVDRRTVVVAGDGRFVSGVAVEALADGFYRYEYAVQNLTSNRAAGSFTVPLPAGAIVRAPGFHDVDYHSGEPFDGTDWAVDVQPQAISFSTVAYDTDPMANALRWGTLYNFRFEADVPPVEGPVTLGLFQPGWPPSVSYATMAPRLCDADGTCEPGENPCNCAVDCGEQFADEAVCNDGIDQDCDGQIDCADVDCCDDLACEDGVDDDGDGVASCDCDDANSSVWALPGGVHDLDVGNSSTKMALTWSPPTDPGGSPVRYDLVRSELAADFMFGAVCVGSDLTTTSAVDPEEPLPGELFHYLVRAENACPMGESVPRQARSCP